MSLFLLISLLPTCQVEILLSSEILSMYTPCNVCNVCKVCAETLFVCFVLWL